MTNEEIKLIMEEAGIDDEKINEFLAAMNQAPDILISEKSEAQKITATEIMLRMKMNNETDWRKKAAIAAQIISLNLE